MSENTVRVERKTYEFLADLAEKSGMSKGKVLANLIAVGAEGLSSVGKRITSGNPDTIEEEGKKLAKVNKLHSELNDEELVDKVVNKVANKLAKANEEPAVFGLVEEEDNEVYCCGNCEAELDGAVSFCPHCGVELKWDGNPDNKKTKSDGWVGVGLAVLVGLALLSKAQTNRV